MPLLCLGPHQFEIAPLNYQSLDRLLEVKWPAISRFGGAPGRQFTGYGEDPITLSGLLFPEEIGGLRELDAVRASAKAALPLTMLGWAGAGLAARVWGLVVILSVSDHHSAIGRTGFGRKVSFDIEVAPLPTGGKPVGLF